MSGRTFAAILLVIVLGIGATALGVSAYNAGVSAGLAQNIAESGGGVVVAPGFAPGPYVGWGGGFGFFWFFGAILFFFLVIGLIRAAFGWGRGPGRGWGRGYGPGGWGPGYGRGGEHGQEWRNRVREIHDELHRSDAGTGDPRPADAPPRS